MRTKAEVIGDWRQRGLILTSKEEGDEIYNRYINSTQCEKCGYKYKSSRDRQMDHSHDINDKYGYFRNVLCQSCNLRRCKLHCDNTSGYPGISKKKDKHINQGFYWRFQISINGKKITIKSSVDFDYLKNYADDWKVENKYSD